nr:hypothetical protein [Tepidiforma sp.]
MHQYRPAFARAGGRGHRAVRLAAAGLLLIAAGAAAACGGKGGDSTASPTAAAVATAADLVPDLSGEGFRLEASGKLPALTPEQDAFIAIFAGSKPGVSSVRIEVNLLPAADAAKAQFAAIADALRNPPPDLFGPGTVQTDGQPVYQADEARSYVTAKPDAQGNLVYSDAYRMGRAIVIVYTLGNDPAAAKAARELVAKEIDRRAPR